MGCHGLLQGIFLTQGSNLHLLCLLHCRWIHYWLSHQGSPVISISFHKGQKKHWLQTTSASRSVINLPCSRGRSPRPGFLLQRGKHKGEQRLTTLEVHVLIPLLKLCHQRLKVPRLPASTPGYGSCHGEQPLVNFSLCSGAHALESHISTKR